MDTDMYGRRYLSRWNTYDEYNERHNNYSYLWEWLIQNNKNYTGAALTEEQVERFNREWKIDISLEDAYPPFVKTKETDIIDDSSESLDEFLKQFERR